VQTFLPYADYQRSAQVLDWRRLGNQRREVIQILNALHEVGSEPGKPIGWSNHPATRMWRGHEAQLCEYGLVFCEEWIARGRRDGGAKATIEWHLETATSGDYELDKPHWFGDHDFHRSHQSNLLRKAHAMTDAQRRYFQIENDYYDQYFVNVPDDLPYVWPV
jgi:hypothetical protein